MAVIQQYPKIDRNYIPNPYEDWFFAEGILNDGRPIRFECWYSTGYTYLTGFISIAGIEGKTKEDLKDLLISEELLNFDDVEFKRCGFGGNNLEAHKIVDQAGNEFWEMVIIIGDEDGTYAHTLFKAQRYTYPEKKTRPGQALDTVGFFLAITKEKMADGYTMYPAYFVNNTGDTVTYTVGQQENAVLGPYSYVEIRRYEGWDFDFANQIVITVHHGGKDEQYCFSMEKYYIAFHEQKENIPVMHTNGWVCLP